MQPPALEASVPPSRDFAGFLAHFAGEGETARPQSEPDEGDGDVDSLSYEHALRSRVRPSMASTQDQTERGSVANFLTSGMNRQGLPDSSMTHKANTSIQPDRRRSSITVRLSAAESDRLHLRASEAGQTVSAYLRSCAFEVESLRAEVKTTLSQLRSLSATKQEPTPARKRRSWLRLFKLPTRLQP